MTIRPESVAVYLLAVRDLDLTLKSFRQYMAGFDSYSKLVYHFNATYPDDYVRSIERDHRAKFIKLEPEVPEDIRKEELFYNLKGNRYARKFGKSRLGYLHMCRIMSNPQSLPGLMNFEFLIQIDDDCALLSHPEDGRDYLDRFAESGKLIGTSHTYSNVTRNHVETRFGLFEFTREFVKNRGVEVKNNQLREALELGDENRFHSLPWTSCNLNFYRSSLFKNTLWIDWITAVNTHGGQYKFRWGDQEIIGLFAYFIMDDPVLDFDLVRRMEYTPKIESVVEYRTGWIQKFISYLRGN